jgi:hypothetical protein
MSWKLWNTKPTLRAAQFGAGVLVDREQVLAGQLHRAAGGRVQPRDDRQQRAFSRARGAHDGGGFPRGQGEIDIAENVEGPRGIGDRFGNVFDGDDGF